MSTCLERSGAVYSRSKAESVVFTTTRAAYGILNRHSGTLGVESS